MLGGNGSANCFQMPAQLRLKLLPAIVSAIASAGCSIYGATPADLCSVESGWELMEAPPDIAGELLALPTSTKPVGEFLRIDRDLARTSWFKSSTGSYLACAYTPRRNTCGSSEDLVWVEFSEGPDGWVPSGPMEQICLVH
jgi:hypothetical protein